MDKEQVIINVDLTSKENIELSSVNSADLMYVRAFATHEGINANGVRFKRETLLKSYKTFIDKPVIMVADKNNLPTGHGYSYATKTFDENKRKYIGHITNAFPVIVNDEGVFTMAEELEENEFPNGELRICVDFVVYKYYLNEIAERLQFLHDIGDFNFSMESKTFGNTENDGIRDCEDILFTGLTVVARPAFPHSQSITVAEEKEEHLMDFEKMYNDLKADYDTLVANNTANEEMANELAEVKTELAEVKGQLAEANSTIESLKPYKEKVEIAEKEALGKERASKLAKFGVEVENTIELAEKTANEFADMLCEAADKMVVVASAETKEEIGMITAQTTMASDKDKLVALFKDFK
jgi:hypothetical protein